MKKLLISLPVLAVLAGCSSSAQSESGANASTISAANAAPESAATFAPASNAMVTDSDITDAIASAKKETMASAATTPVASTRTYQVDTETPPGFPADAAAALKKAYLPPPPASMKIAAKTRVQLVTNKGKIVVEIDGKAAPLQAKSFVYLAGRKFYDGVQFHRYVDGFVIQGGDPLSKNKTIVKKYAGQGLIGAGGPGYSIPREESPLRHDDMMIAAARSGDPDSAGSQFYFTLGAQHALDQGPQAQDGYGYVVFGKVLSGKDVVRKLREGDEIKSATVLK